MPPAILTTFLVLTVILVLLPSEVAAFGAGDIPDFSYLEGKAFRHGDIENTLLELVKAVAHSHGGGLLGLGKSILSAATGGAKFSKEDVKHVYFGNWLRDYSQAMDVAGLTKLSPDTITLIVGVLGFLEFGFATEEFEVTQDRLGVYLPVEHIDNPRGYADNVQGKDARSCYNKLRPPVDPRELEIDPRTGMKNYMATENQGWDTSTAFIRRSLRDCIQKGRDAGGREGAELWEAYRLLGQGLHTLEDFTAHSNWVEIALLKLGHQQVFCHVGDNVRVNSPKGRVPPIVTGTFGGADFFHSLLGETTDKISQSSVTDLSAKMSDNKSNSVSGLKDILGKLSALGGGDNASEVNQAEEMKRKSEAYHFDPNQALPPQVVKNLKEVLKFHDDVMRGIIKKMEMVPGLTSLLDALSNALNAFVYTTIAPYVTPVLMQVTGAVGEGSAAVISSSDQWEVFNNNNASDPTHSVLSKDHFGIILNEPAGKVAKVVVEHSVNLIVEAWSNNSNPDDAINKILEAFHHPHYSNGRSEIQNRMINVVNEWLSGMGNAQETIGCLTKEAVRQGRNKRQGEDSGGQGSGAGYSGGYSTGAQTGGSFGGYSTQQSYSSGGSQQPQPAYGGGSGENKYGGGSYRKPDDNSHSNKQTSHGRPDQSAYGSSQSSYKRSDDNYSGGQQTSYGLQGANYQGSGQTTHGRPDRDDTSYGREQGGYPRPSDSSFGSTQGGQGGSNNTYGKTQSPGQRGDGLYRSTQGSGGYDNKPYESTQSSVGRPDNTHGDNRGGRRQPENRSYESGYARPDDVSYRSTQVGSGLSETGLYGGTQGSYGQSDSFGGGSNDTHNQRESTHGSGSTRRGGSGETPHRGGQGGYGGSDNIHDSGSHGRREELRSGSGGSGNISSRRDDGEKSYNSGGFGSGYSPSYQQTSERDYSSGNTHSSGSTRPSQNYGGGHQTGAGYNISAGYQAGGSLYSSGGPHEGHSKKDHKHQHRSDDGETYGVGQLNLRDDSDDEKPRRGRGEKSYGRSEGYQGGGYSGGNDNY